MRTIIRIIYFKIVLVIHDHVKSLWSDGNVVIAKVLEIYTYQNIPNGVSIIVMLFLLFPILFEGTRELVKDFPWKFFGFPIK